jgi:diguanylate cyclase (GGDEF)-like protein/PAS domain S-box-containing protein
MMGVKPYHSLRFRLIASVVIIEVVMLSVMVWNNIDSIYSTHTDRLIDTSSSLLQQFASAAGAYMAEVDYAGLEDAAASILKHDEVAYLEVLDVNSHPILRLGDKLPTAIPTPDADPTQVTDGIYDVAKDITLADRLQGRLLLGFSLNLMKADITKALNRSVAIAVTEIVLSVFATIIIGMGLTRNLRSLAAAAARVGDGHYDTTLDISRRDEVGLTARAFNKMVADIADRTHRIRESESQTRLLMDSTAEAIIGVDNNSCCIFVNQACLRLLGYDHPEEIVGKDFHVLAHHSYSNNTPYPPEQCSIRNGARSTDTFHTAEEYFWRKDGTGFPVEAWTYPIKRDGETTGYVVTFFDITERKRAVAALDRLNRQVHLLLESTGEGIFGVDAQLRCTFVNNAATHMLGYASDEILGQDMHELVHARREDGSAYPLEETLIYRSMKEQRVLQSDDEVLWTKKGDIIPTQYSSSPIFENGAITGAAIVFRNIAEARALARKMDFLATHDPLTGLANRREFETRLEQALANARVEGNSHFLCYMDLDQFKVVNDTCGHVAGDELLRQLTAMLHSQIRKGDTLARLGGDEFGILLQHCSLEDAVKNVEDIRQSVWDFRFVWEDKTFTLGVSIGLTIIARDTTGIGTALSEADAACYIAKDSGRNRIHIYQADDADPAQRHGEMQWVSRIHDALNNDRFCLYFQTIVPIEKTIAAVDRPAESLVHVEILLRMNDENGENLPPGAFIPAAERYNLMPAIDRWVVSSTFMWLRDNKAHAENIGFFAINLSGHSLSDENFLTFVSNQLEAMELAGNNICFEITETAAVANLTQAMHFMNTLKSRGCRFALDDFGSGMSSFAYLKNLPVDYLKIDGNFVRDVMVDRVDHAMVRAINQVGQVMGIKTVAEFVESPAILAELRKIGVDYAQGYSIAEPKPLDEFSWWTSGKQLGGAGEI